VSGVIFVYPYDGSTSSRVESCGLLARQQDHGTSRKSVYKLNLGILIPSLYAIIRDSVTGFKELVVTSFRLSLGKKSSLYHIRAKRNPFCYVH